MQIIEQPTEFHVRIPYTRFTTRNTNLIKLIDGARFDWTRKAWIVPFSKRNELEEVQNKTRAEWIIAQTRVPEQITPIPDMPELEFDIDIVNRDNGYKPFPYQLQGIARGLQLKKFINGDEQGLGKTLQSIATIYTAHKYNNEQSFPCLVICPASTKINWQREWEMWTGKKAMILDDKVKDTWHRFYELGMHDVFIVNYESLKKYFVDYMPPKGKLKRSSDIQMNPRVKLFNSVIIDEIHRCKDRNTQQTKIALQIAIGKLYRIGLTGTMIVNKPIDALPQLAIIGKLANEKVFRERYCEGGSGASNLRELKSKLYEYCFFRREKKDVAKDLPDKLRQTILCDITNRAEYNKAKNDFVKWMEESGCNDEEIARKLRGEIMVRMGVLKQISAKGKINEVKEFIDEIIESGEKLILFHNLHDIGDEIRRLYPAAVSVNGRMDGPEKQRAIDSFQKDPNVQLIVCNIKAAGVGITLTASSRVAFIEYPWTYADCAQCEDRAHRIGQKNNVMCTYFLGQNTIDEDMYKMIQDKRHVGNAITGATDQMEMNFIDNVINLFK